MRKGYIARSSTTINAPRNKVWNALTDPQAIKQYMFGTRVTSDWKPGSSISWKGEWEGKPYEDKGVIVRALPSQELEYTHYSPMMGLPDKPENYHTVTIELSGEESTHVTLSQDNNSSEEEKQHSEKNWSQMLAGLKKYAEG